MAHAGVVGNRAARRRAAKAALALGASAVTVGAVGVVPAGAGVPTPTTTATCSIVDFGGQPTPESKLRTTGLAPNRDFATWIYADLDGGSFSFDGFYFRSDANGVIEPFPFTDDPPTYFAWTVYDDLNSNDRWDRDVDRTYFRGEGTVTDCPQTITLSPK